MQFSLDKLENLKQLRNLGIDPYESKLNYFFPKKFPIFEDGEGCHSLGRIISHRIMGKIAFLTLLIYSEDDPPTPLQVVFKKDFTISSWETILPNLDIGDMISFYGIFQITKAGEKSVFIKEFQVIAKAIVPIPFGKSTDKGNFNTIKDPKELNENRHLALLLDSDLRQNLINRSKIIQRIRSFLDKERYICVQTPILTSFPGGAESTPFNTFYNAYNQETSLRISLEIPLKKLLCAGFNKVYEIGSVFRNEGTSSIHNPEFTLLEYYTAYVRYLEQGISKFKMLMNSITEKEFEWSQYTVKEAMLKFLKVDTTDLSSDQIISYLPELESLLINPTILTHQPKELAPLAKSKDGITSERFEAYINGIEIANGFCEQNDPVVQLQILEEQNMKMGVPIDYSFIHALSCGMPQSFGVGIGIDRLVMALLETNHIRNITWFPFAKIKG